MGRGGGSYFYNDLNFLKMKMAKIYAVLVSIIKIKKILIIKQGLKSLKSYAINTAE